MIYFDLSRDTGRQTQWIRNTNKLILIVNIDGYYNVYYIYLLLCTLC